MIPQSNSDDEAQRACNLAFYVWLCRWRGLHDLLCSSLTHTSPGLFDGFTIMHPEMVLSPRPRFWKGCHCLNDVTLKTGARI